MWTSSLRSWLNSSAPKGKVVWLDGCRPDDDHVNNEFPYEDEKGFLEEGNFTASELSVLKSVSQKTLLNEEAAAKLKTGGTGPHVDCNESIYEALTNYDEVYYKKANGAYTKEKVTTNTKVFTNLTKSTKCTYKVTAVNSSGEGKPTVELWKVTSK